MKFQAPGDGILNLYFRILTMQIIPLSEGTFTIDKSKIFVPFNTATDDLQKRPAGSLLVEVQPFVVITSKDILLIDTGLGFSVNGEMQVHESLRENNIRPEDVTKVLLSHLHKDHAGGVSRKDRLGNYSLSFPAATYYLQKKEMEFAMDTGFPSFMTEEISILQDAPNVVWLEGDGEIDNYISYKVTAAHSPFHQVFWIREGDEILFFGGDDAPQLQQMKSKFVAKYDYDGKKCMQLRQEWWEQGRTGGWTFMFYHDIKTPFFKQMQV
jgi:glyoxylase-like metal-dependent hydrolase (beta-lactamase superfamily II)